MTETTCTGEGIPRSRYHVAKRLARVVLALSGLCVIAFVVGFAVFAIHVAQLQPPAALAPADGIVVLTGGQSRIDTGLDLLKAGKGKRLLISGVNPAARVDDLRLATGSERSLFNCCVDIDRVALNTVGNAEESAKWASANTYGSIIVVTNNYHMPRSLLEMRRILPDTDLQPYPVVNSPLTDGSWVTDPDALRVLITEYTKYVAALARGLLPSQTAPAFGKIQATVVSN
ncbi:YdcF family protein [Chelativorans sp. SCAU2101]|uniref:YdcF family protein n=1 Tax=Chelativorans petroleitrophicus TaxID=2975484 RepID=A0A9X3AZ64_9HYPH|nr:YdcF family protein [Chelativorans petroleitrophicus]MCT8989660.1 YdcF family protein [Chelativorans petroleitrophicus]